MQKDSFICAVITALLITCFAQALVSATNSISRSSSEICTGPDAENEVLCVGTTMGAAESTQELVNGVQSLEISSTSSSYSGNVQQVLNQVLGKLKLQEDEIKRTNEKLDILVKQKLIEGLKEQSPLFNKLFKEIAWTGSYYEGLKISHPDEFDLNVILKLPVSEDQIKIEARESLPGYVTVSNFGPAVKKLEEDPTWKQGYNELLKWADPDTGNLLQTKVFQWMEGIVSKFATKYNRDALPQEQIKVHKSGPAITLIIGRKLSIDLVPVFGFTFAPPYPIKTPKPLNRKWMIVPKPLKETNGVVDAWRVNFYQFELEILRDFGTIKPAIKLVKKLRDTLQIKSLYSYAIKTVAIWLMESGGLSKTDKIDMAFLKLLRKVKDYLNDGFLPFYWEDQCNMLKMGDMERQGFARRLEKLLHKFEVNWEDNAAFIGDTIMPESVQVAAQEEQNNNCTMS